MFRNLLRNKNFMRLWNAQTLSQLEATIVDLTIVLVITDAIKDSTLTFGASATALVFALQFIPALPAALVAGVIADIMDRRKLLIFLNVFRSAFLLLFVFAANPGAHLFFFVFIMAICMHTYDVAEKASIKNVTPDKDVSLANGLFLFTMNATTLVGVVAAGFLKEWIGFKAVLLSGSILYAFAAILVYKLPRNLNNYAVDKYKHDDSILIDTQKAVTRVLKSIKESIRYLFSNPPVWIAVTMVTLVQTVMLTMASISFRFGSDVLGISSSEVSIFLLIPIAAGLALAGTQTARLTRRFSYKNIIFFSWFVGSVLLLVIGSIGFLQTHLRPGLTFEFILFEILLVLMGFSITLVQAPAMDLIQKFADSKIRGRVFGILVGATNTVAGILVALSGVFIEILSTDKNDPLGTPRFLVAFSIALIVLMFIIKRISGKIMKGKDFISYEKPEKITITTTT